MLMQTIGGPLVLSVKVHESVRPHHARHAARGGWRKRGYMDKEARIALIVAQAALLNAEMPRHRRQTRSELQGLNIAYGEAEMYAIMRRGTKAC